MLEKIQRYNFCRLHYTHFKTLDYIDLNVEESSINKLYEYLNREFQKKNRMVISRKIYNNENVDKKKIKEIFKGFSK